MKLGDICPAPCFAHAAGFDIPSPGCKAHQLKFADGDGRQYYAVLLTNHELHPLKEDLSPKLAIVGLSPAGNQIKAFVDAYERTKSYTEASIQGAFAGLAQDIIAMFRGVGLTAKLGIRFPFGDTLARHPDIYVTSLIGCASLDEDGGSDDFRPDAFEGSRRCAVDRFVSEMISPRFSRLGAVVIFGTKGRDAVSSLRVRDGMTILQKLEANGKVVLFFPHPSPQNVEYVRLASLPLDRVPTEQDYVNEMWEEYRIQPPRKGRTKETEEKYRSKRRAVWNSIYKLRWEVANLEVRG